MTVLLIECFHASLASKLTSGPQAPRTNQVPEPCMSLDGLWLTTIELSLTTLIGIKAFWKGVQVYPGVLMLSMSPFCRECLVHGVTIYTDYKVFISQTRTFRGEHLFTIFVLEFVHILSLYLLLIMRSKLCTKFSLEKIYKCYFVDSDFS